MGETIIKEAIAFAKERWHSKVVGICLPSGLTCFLLLYFSNFATSVPPIQQIFLAFVAGATLQVVWIVSHRVPHFTKGKVGILLSISSDDEALGKQFETDFISKTRQLVNASTCNMEFKVLPPFLHKRIQDDHKLAFKMLLKTQGRFMLYGTIKKRRLEGKETFVLNIFGVVAHGRTSDQVSKALQSDFMQVLPAKITLPADNDAFCFESTSEWTHTSTRYVIGLAAMISGDFEYAEKLLVEVEQNLKQGELPQPLKELQKRLPQRLIELYLLWNVLLYGKYFGNRDKQILIPLDRISSCLLARQPLNYQGILTKCICDFMLRRDIKGAKVLLNKCNGTQEPSWLLSLAFLHAYEGNLDAADSHYERAFSLPFNHQNVAIQCEEFISIVLSEEPSKTDLYYALGTLNMNTKSDFAAAHRDLTAFVNAPQNKRNKRILAKAKNFLAICAKKIADQSAVAISPEKPELF